MNQLIIKDNNGNDYIVNNPYHFRQHLLYFHISNGKPDLSPHEENGHYFTVTSKLLYEVNKYIKINKQ